MSRIAKEVEVYGFDTNNKRVVKYHFECDTIADLPTVAEATADNTIMLLGSTAHIIDPDSRYEFKSDGTWVKQKGELELSLDAAAVDYDNTTSGMAADNLQDAIDETHAEITGLQTENTSQQNEIDYAINTGAKNLLNPADYIKNSAGGLTITETGTGTYKITGTPSGTVDVFTTPSGTFDRMYGLQAGKSYTISGLPTDNGLLCRIDVSKNNSGSWNAQIISNLTLPRTFTVPSDATGLYIRYRVTTSATIPVGGILLQPMIRPASITDPTYEPYALPNPTLTPAAIKSVDEGAKNLVNAPSGSGVRFINIPIVLQPGDYYVLFQNITSTDTDASTCQFGAFANDDSQASNYPQLKRGDNTGAMFTVRKQTSYVRLYAANDFAKGAGDTVTFTGCMICTAADWAVSQKFVPYAPTNRELYEMILQLQSAAGLRTVSTLRSAAAPLQNEIEEEVTEDEER